MAVKRITFTFAVLLWAAFIFLFSAQPADTSTELSYSVGEKIGQWFVPGFDDRTDAEQRNFAAAVDYPVRKSAHALEYAVLAFLIAGLLHSFYVKRIWTPLLTIAYAATDEIHQLFVPGRSGQISDVLLDGIGGLAGFLFFAFCLYIYRRVKNGQTAA